MRASLRNPNHSTFNAELNRLVSAIPAAAYTVDKSGVITSYNDRAVTIWGRCPRPEEKWCGAWKAFTSDGEPLTLECAPMGQTMQTKRPILGQQVIVERPDGTRILVSPFPHPLFDSSNEIAGAVNLMLPAQPNAIVEADYTIAERNAQHLSRFLVPLAELARTMSGVRHLEEAAADVMDMLCHTLDAAVGTFWLLDGKLRLRPICCIEATLRRGKYGNFVRLTRQCILSWGADLPGRAAGKWQSIWLDDLQADEEIRRGTLAADNGLTYAVAYPLVPTGSGPVRGVIELFFAGQAPDQDWTQELLSSTCSLLGDFIAQRDLEQAMRENQRRTRIESPGFVSAIFGRGGASPTAAQVHRRY
jgi:PAS domain-containing protein